MDTMTAQKRKERRGKLPLDFFEMGTVTDDLAPYWREGHDGTNEDVGPVAPEGERKGALPLDFFEMGTVTDDLAPYWRDSERRAEKERDGAS